MPPPHALRSAVSVPLSPRCARKSSALELRAAKSAPDPQEPNYHGSVEMSGWVEKYKARLRTSHVRRYFRLNNSILSNHPQLTAPSTWEVSVSRSIVYTEDHRNMVIVRLIDREIRFQCATTMEMRRWANAIRCGSVCNINDFYKLGKQIAFGSFGAIRFGVDLVTGEKRAVKIVERTNNAKELEFLQREMNVLLCVSHPYIVRTYDIFDERDKIYLVMEFVGGGDFFEYMAKRVQLKEMEAKHVMWQIMRGIEYLHDNNIVHRDIKPENVLVASLTPLHLQLTDFGFANFVDSSKKNETYMKSMVGTGCYMAPEVIDLRGHGKPVDIFAAGVVMFRVLSGMLPFRGLTIHECYRMAMDSKMDFYTKEWRGISKGARDLCAKMMCAQPEGRPTTKECLAHAWFAEDEQFAEDIEEVENAIMGGMKGEGTVKVKLGSMESEVGSDVTTPRAILPSTWK